MMTAGSSGLPVPEAKKVLRPAAEERWADELAALAAADAQRGAEIPQGWRLSPHSVRAFIVGTRTSASPGSSTATIP